MYLLRFDPEDVDLIRSPTGGWHATYRNDLARGINKTSNPYLDTSSVVADDDIDEEDGFATSEESDAASTENQTADDTLFWGSSTSQEDRESFTGLLHQSISSLDCTTGKQSESSFEDRPGRQVI